MSNIAALSLLAYFDETTQGTPPADAAAWISDGVRLRHLADSLDVSGVERSLLEDPRNHSRVKATDPRIVGLDNPEFPFAVPGTGLGGTTATGNQAATTLPGYQLAYLLGHALGGVSRGYSNTVSGGASTTTTVDVADSSNHAVGDYIAIQFATAVSGYAATTVFPRRIISIDSGGSPHVLTIDQALPQAPAADDLVHAGVTAYIDESVLANSAAGPYTRSWLVQKGLPGAASGVRESWVFKGTVAQLQQFSLARNGLLQFAFQVMAGSHDSPIVAPWPTAWSSNTELGLAPLSLSPLTQVWFVNDGTTTNTLVEVSKFDVEPGVPRVRHETVTSGNVNMQGTYSFSTQPADTLVTMALTPFGISQWTDQNAATQKELRFARLGPAGSAMCIHFPRLSHAATPKRSINNANTDVEIQLLAHEEENLGSSNLQQSAMTITLF